MEILTDFQKEALRALSEHPHFADYYLTGGTALSAFYLKHRYSEDLDFFTESPGGVARAETIVRSLADKLGLRLTMGRRFQTLFECSAHNQKGETIEMDFALDMPGRLKPMRPREAFGVDLDNAEDISCNKLSALYERAEPKDFVDIYFIVQDILPFRELWEKSRLKYPSLDAYGLAVAFSKVKSLDILPRMVRPIALEMLRSFFLERASELSKAF